MRNEHNGSEFVGEITTLKAENHSLKEQIQRQAKSVANAIATKGKAPYKEVLTHGYTVDEQVKTAERYSVLAQTEIPKQATPKTNDVER